MASNDMPYGTGKTREQRIAESNARAQKRNVAGGKAPTAPAAPAAPSADSGIKQPSKLAQIIRSIGARRPTPGASPGTAGGVKGPSAASAGGRARYSGVAPASTSTPVKVPAAARKKGRTTQPGMSERVAPSSPTPKAKPRRKAAAGPKSAPQPTSRPQTKQKAGSTTKNMKPADQTKKKKGLLGRIAASGPKKGDKLWTDSRRAVRRGRDI